MINGYLDEFMFCLTYGLEVIFWYNNQKFYLLGGEVNGVKKLFLTRWEPYMKEPYLVLEGTKDEYPVKKFLTEPIIDGKTFAEIEPTMKWVDE